MIIVVKVKDLVWEIFGSAALSLYAAQSRATGNAKSAFLSYGITMGLLLMYGGSNPGGIFNPIFSLANGLRKKISMGVALIYIIFQLLGSMLGALILRFLTPEIARDAMANKTYPRPSEPLFTMMEHSWQLFIVEYICSFILVFMYCYVVQHVGVNTVQGASTVAAATISLCLASMFYTGGSMNPAIVFGPMAIFGGPSTGSGVFWVYFTAPLIAVFLAVYSFDQIENKMSIKDRLRKYFEVDAEEDSQPSDPASLSA